MANFEKDPNPDKFEDDAEDIKPIELPGGAAPPPPPAAMPRVPKPPQPNVALAAAGVELTGQTDEIARNLVKKGDYVDLLKKAPTLRELYVGAGWELKNLEGDKIDVDLSCFLLDKTGLTRVNEDFIYYNNEKVMDGAVKHLGDSRGGDGGGDDETLFFDLNGIPFDVIRIVLVLSIYDEALKGWHFGMVKELFLRLVNKDENEEILRVALNEDGFHGQTAIHVASIVREGPKWFLEVLENFVPGGHAAVAKQYGLIVREDTG